MAPQADAKMYDTFGVHEEVRPRRSRKIAVVAGCIAVVALGALLSVTGVGRGGGGSAVNVENTQYGCFDVTFTTASVAYSDSAGPFTVTGYSGNLPSACSSSYGASCNVNVCAASLAVQAQTYDAWKFTATTLEHGTIISDQALELVDGDLMAGSSTTVDAAWGYRPYRHTVYNGDVYLGGDFMEVGIQGPSTGSHGRMGAYGYPTDFKGAAKGVGMVADADGFGVGTELNIDFFMPGCHLEGYSFTYDGGGTNTNAATSIADESTDVLLKARIVASTGSLTVNQVITFEKHDKLFKNEITFENTGGSTLTGVKFVRMTDPDNTVDQGGSYTTINVVDKTIAEDSMAMVSATSQDGDSYYTKAGSQGARLIYFSTDAFASARHGSYCGGFRMTPADDSVLWSPVQPKGDTQTTDNTICIFLDVGTIGAYSSIVGSYYTSLGSSAVPVEEVVYNAFPGSEVAILNQYESSAWISSFCPAGTIFSEFKCEGSDFDSCSQGPYNTDQQIQGAHCAYCNCNNIHLRCIEGVAELNMNDVHDMRDIGENGPASCCNNWATSWAGMYWANAGNIPWTECMKWSSYYGALTYASAYTSQGWSTARSGTWAYWYDGQWYGPPTKTVTDNNNCILGRLSFTTAYDASAIAAGNTVTHDGNEWRYIDLGTSGGISVQECYEHANSMGANIIQPGTIGETASTGYHMATMHSCDIHSYVLSGNSYGYQNGGTYTNYVCRLGVMTKYGGEVVRGTGGFVSCYDFASEASVSSCAESSCAGAEATHCKEANCATGYENYDSTVGTCSSVVCGCDYVSDSNYAGTCLSGSYAQTVYVTCNSGWSGTGYATCNADKTWSKPTCTVNYCTDVTPSNSLTNLHGYTYQTQTVSCSSGYEGGGTATCQTSGSWSYPSCTRKWCNSNSVANSNYAGGNSITGQYTDNVYVTCNAGYSGSGNAYCNADQSFSLPTCTANPCNEENVDRSNYKSSASRVSAASFTIWSNTYSDGQCSLCPGSWYGGSHDSACSTACTRWNSDSIHSGYSSSWYDGSYPGAASSGERGCGFWNAGCALNCQCAWNSGLASTLVALRGNTGQQLYVTCDSGWYGDGYATCQTDATWSKPTCSAGTCPSTQVDFSNYATANSITGTVGGKTTVTCNQGYSGGGDMTCMSDLTWSSVTCTAIECATSSVPDSDFSAPGSIAGRTTDTVAVTCNDGYFGSGSVTCQSNQLFTTMECKGYAFLGVYTEDQIPGWPSWSCDEGAESYYVGCSRLSGTQKEIADQCAIACSARDATFFDVHDTTACFCGVGTNKASSSPYQDPVWTTVTADPPEAWTLYDDKHCNTAYHIDMSDDADQCYKNPDRSGYDSSFSADSNWLCLDEGDCKSKCESTTDCVAVDMVNDFDRCRLGTASCRTATNWVNDDTTSHMLLSNTAPAAATYKRGNSCEDSEDWRMMTEGECMKYSENEGYSMYSPFSDAWDNDCRGCIYSDGVVAFNTHDAPGCTNTWVTVCTGDEVVSCDLTIDNALTSVKYNGESLAISGSLTDWGSVKTINFQNAGRGAKLEIEGYEYSTGSCGCSCSGLGLTCTSSDPTSAWHGFTSDVGHWKAYGNTNSDVTGTATDVCVSTSGFYLNNGKSYTKIWPSNGGQYARFEGAPYSDVTTGPQLNDGLGAYNSYYTEGNLVRFSWGSDYIEFKPKSNIFQYRPNNYNNGQKTDNIIVEVDNFKTSNSALMSWVDEAGGAIFCLSNTYAWDTAWAILPQDNNEWAIGCNSGGWAGRGAYYGDDNYGAGWVGVKDNGEAKAGAAYVWPTLTITTGDSLSIPYGYQNYHYALDEAVAPCASTEVRYSDHDETNSIFGVTGDTVAVECDNGYSGSGTAACDSTGSFSAITCTANPCTATEVPYSDKASTGAIYGVTEDVVRVTCDKGYSGTETVICQDTGSFSPLVCTPNPCIDEDVMYSDYKEAGSIKGRTTDTVLVTCDAGYSSSVCVDHTCGLSGTSDTATCENTGLFTLPTCTAIPCAPYQVEFSVSYEAAGSITGATTDSTHVVCKDGYTTQASPVAGALAESKTTTCQTDATFSEVICTPIPCFDDDQVYSSHKVTDSITGATDDTVDVLCDLGYTGSDTTTCLPGSEWSEQTCIANPCIPMDIPFSNYKAEGSVTGTTTQTVEFTCDRGWSANRGVYTMHTDITECLPGCRDCHPAPGADGIWRDVECAPNPCTPWEVEHSNYATAASIDGFCTDVRHVDCDPGYSRYGRWAVDYDTVGYTSAEAKEVVVAGVHEPETDTTCMPTDESPGYWSWTTCLPNPCDKKTVPHSDKKSLDSIFGVTDEVVHVVCDFGYEVFGAGGEEGLQEATTTCLSNGTFSFLECAPRSRVGFILRESDDTPKMTGTNEDGSPIWSYGKPTFNVDYFAPAFISELAATKSFISTMFRITHNTLAFVAGHGSAATGGATITLRTDFEGSFLTGLDAGIERRVHSPDLRDSYEVVWEVAGLLGRKAAFTVVDNDPSADILIDNLRLFDTGTGCLPECLRMDVTSCTAAYATPEPDMNCLWFQEAGVPYTPVKTSETGLIQYCRYGLGPFGENGQTSLMTGWPADEGINTERLSQFGMLPACLYMQVVNEGVFGFSLDSADPIFAYDRMNQPNTTAEMFEDNMYCIYNTAKPRCASFDGVLKSRTQHNLYCEDEVPEATCMELVYEKKCPAGKLCGTNDIGVTDETTLNLLQCCDRSNNDPGSGCLTGRRRRRRRLSEATENALLADVDAGEACAEQCMRKANGPQGKPLADACVAWRLAEDTNDCIIATDCMYEEMALSKLLSKKLWNTFDGVSPFKNQATPLPKMVRKFRTVA